MKITFLGTGTSVGIPVIGCKCPVCHSADPRNRRRRASLYVESGSIGIVIDTPPDFREQALQFAVPRVDAVLITHCHADHIFGFDDIRRYNTLQDMVIPAYGSPETIADMNRIFFYVHKESPPDTYRPRILFQEIAGPFEVVGVRVTPIPVRHGAVQTLGYRLDAGGCSLGYVPDCHEMSDEGLALLAGVDVMVLDALRHKPHSTHLHLEASAGILRRIGAGQSFMTHMNHDLEHAATESEIGPGIHLAYDGLRLAW